ncbi:MAG: RagB/SusD family nutrient uptake outer membrane protein [Prolixibacteraceae bacterium]
MKIKNINIGIILALLAGCNDEFLERAPLDQISDESFWKAEKDLQLYCNTFYTNSFPVTYDWATEVDGLSVLKHLAYRDIISDNCAPWTEYVTTTEGLRIPAGNYVTPTASGSGEWNWTNMRRLNYFLDNYARADIDESKKQVYAGEILFFKTMDYFNKVKLFGDVPWLSSTLNIDSPELYTARTPRAQVMDSVLNIINTSIEYLPAKGEEETDRLNKDVALFLKARLCLYEGTYRKYHTALGLDGTKFLNEAINACEKLMNSGNYSLYSTGDISNDYYNLFRTQSYAGNPEVILWKEYSLSESLGSAFSWGYEQNIIQNSATRSLVEEYLCSDGLPISVSPLYLGSDSIQSEFTNRDPRLKQTICNFGERMLRPGVWYNGNNPLPTLNGMSGGAALPERRCPSGFRICKWWEDDHEDADRVTLGQQAFPIYRYAEILLTYAEAKFELNQCSQDVLNNSINLIRTRAGMPSLSISNLPSDPRLDGYYEQYCDYVPDPLLREIRRERRIEFVFENLRYDDMMRWEAGNFFEIPVQGIKFVQSQFGNRVTVNQDIFLSEEGYILPYKQFYPNGRVFDENKHYLFPIPLEDLVLNPNLVQNPGWDTP